MGAGLYYGDPTGDPDGLPSDPEKWSEDSKGSVAYKFLDPRPYLDRAYCCWRCGAPDVFTAAEQKHTFEVRKANINQARKLCRACHRAWVGLEQEAAACRRRWAAGRPALRRDPAFLRRWLAVLEELPRYGRPVDRANVVMLGRLVRGQGADPPTAPAPSSG